MTETNVRSFREVAKAISMYGDNQEEFMKKLKQQKKELGDKPKGKNKEKQEGEEQKDKGEQDDAK